MMWSYHSVGEMNVPIIGDVRKKLSEFASQAGQAVRSDYDARRASVTAHDANYICLSTNNLSAYEFRWRLYTNACGLEEFADQRPWNIDAIKGAHSRFDEIDRSLKADNAGAQGIDLSQFIKR